MFSTHVRELARIASTSRLEATNRGSHSVVTIVGTGAGRLLAPQHVRYDPKLGRPQIDVPGELRSLFGSCDQKGEGITTHLAATVR
jgi:hypothetical protein